MGLDTCASRTPDDELTPADKAVFAELDLFLCEWIRDGCFRGKVYIDVVDRVAGYCLAYGWSTPEEVAEIADAFDACDPDEVVAASSRDHYPVDRREVLALRRFFRICADRGLGLVGS